MTEVIKLGENTLYIPGRTNIGIYRENKNDIYVVDSGENDEDGMLIENVIESKGWNLKGILNTHAHVDHVGGNRYLQKKYDCPAFCSGADAAVITYSKLEPSLTYGGHPFRDISDHEWMPKSSNCISVSDSEFPKDVEVIEIPGHSIAQIGYRFSDGSVFIGDAVASRKTVERYPMLFVHNISGHISSLNRLKNVEGICFVPSHGKVIESRDELNELIDINIEVFYRIRGLILSFLDEPKDMERILKCIFDHFGMNMNYDQYILTLRILRSYITWLKDDDEIEAFALDNMFLWRRKK